MGCGGVAISKKVSTIHPIVGIARRHKHSIALPCHSNYSIVMYVAAIIRGLATQRNYFLRIKLTLGSLWDMY